MSTITPFLYNFNTTKYRLSFLVCMVFSLIAGLITVIPAGAQETEDDKGIRIRRGDQDSSLQVTFKPIKSEFAVGEPLRFTIRGNKRFFLYLYTIDPDTGQMVLVLPNQRQTTNQYEANRTYRVPNSNVEFYADEPGRERITMLATTRYLEIDSARFNKSGDFLSGSTETLEDEFESKGIRIRGPERDRRASNKVVKELDIAIGGYSSGNPGRGGIGGGSGTANNDPIVFLSTEKEQYAVGEKVRIVFGADREGWVHLYTTEPDGHRSLLTRKKVNGKELQHASAQAQAPGGEHALIAIYTEERSFDDTLLDDMSEDKLAGKGLTLVSSDSSISSAVQRFWIED